MITSAIINLSSSLLNWLINLFPTSTGFPNEAHQAVTYLGGYLGIWSPILPTNNLIGIITLVIAVEVGIFGFKTLKWIISHIPMIGGKG